MFKPIIIIVDSLRIDELKDESEESKGSETGLLTVLMVNRGGAGEVNYKVSKKSL